MTTSENSAVHATRQESAGHETCHWLETIAPQLLQVHEAAADFGVFVLDRSGRVMSWNPLASRATGFRPDQILGRNIASLNMVNELAKSRLMRILATAAAAGRCENQMMLTRKNGESFRAEIVVTAVCDENEDLRGFGCMIREISERKGTERAGAAAIESARLKSAFVDNISHEFRTPLNIILGYSDMIGEHLADVHDTSQDDCLDAVSRACKRLLRTFNAVLDHSKLESRSLIVNSRTVVLAPLVHGLIDEVRPAAAKKGLRLTLEFDDRALALTIDKYCFTNALRNLLENAIKFTEAGSISVNLTRDRTGAICLSVADTGIGIDSAFIPQLFKPFTQEDCGPARRFEGTGLGLALTRRYLELNGADLTVLSEKGRGSTFTVHFARPDIDASESELPFDDGKVLLP